MRELVLIAAVGTNRAIGRANRLLWRLPEDMRHFREKTRGRPVVMGRKTWESLPDAFRPLPGRLNIVVSRNPAYTARGATRAASLEEALAAAGESPEIFVIGGAELYRQAMPLAQRLCLTEVEDAPDADAFFPVMAADEWVEISRAPGGSAGSDQERGPEQPKAPEFSFVEYQRRVLQSPAESWRTAT